jgi:tetratricopeptide (TPR) repeat protein
VRVYPLGVLPPSAADDLLRTRAQATPRQEPILVELAASLGGHALALDLAGRRLRRIPPNQWQRYADETALAIVEGTVFAHLSVPEEQRDQSVEAVLARSYDDLDETARAHFRQLGAFAPEASFRTEAAAGVWECSPDDAWGRLATFADQGLLQRIAVLDESRWQQHGLLRAYAVALLRTGIEANAARARHAAVQSALIGEADDKQVYYRLLPDHPQLVHAFAWAVDHDVPLAANLAANTANLQAAFGLVRFSHEWATRLLRAAETTDDRRLYAAALGTLGNALSALAELPRQSRPARLREALAAYDAALTIHTPQDAPLDYATTQSNRGVVLHRLAEIRGEDRGARMREALAAFDSALVIWIPRDAPINHATAQNNRGNVLQGLAGLPGEDPGARLREALAAYDVALRCGTPQVAPLDHAMTQYNKGNVLQWLAELPDENRESRLREALAAYEIALQYRTPEVAPLDHALTQENKSVVVRRLAEAPGEDRMARLREAFRLGWIALEIFGELGYAHHWRAAMGNLRETRRLAGDDFSRLWAGLGVGEPPDWLNAST